MAGHGDGEAGIVASDRRCYQMVIMILKTLNKAEMKSIDRHKEAREKIDSWIAEVILELTLSFGYTADVYKDLQSRSSDGASEAIQNLLDEFGAINHLEQEVCMTQRSDEGPTRILFVPLRTFQQKLQWTNATTEKIAGRMTWSTNLSFHPWRK